MGFDALLHYDFDNVWPCLNKNKLSNNTLFMLPKKCQKMFTGQTGSNLAHHQHEYYRHLSHQNPNRAHNHSLNNSVTSHSQNGIQQLQQNQIPASQSNLLTNLNQNHSQHNDHQQQQHHQDFIQQEQQFVAASGSHDQVTSQFLNASHLRPTTGCSEDITQLGTLTLTQPSSAHLYETFHSQAPLFQSQRPINLHEHHQDHHSFQLHHAQHNQPQNQQRYINLLCIANPLPYVNSAANEPCPASTTTNLPAHDAEQARVDHDRPALNATQLLSYTTTLPTQHQHDRNNNQGIEDSVNTALMSSAAINSNINFTSSEQQFYQSHEAPRPPNFLFGDLNQRRSSSQSLPNDNLSKTSSGNSELGSENIIGGRTVRKGRRNSESPRRTFNCPTCSKGFTEKFNMKRHMQIHQQLRPKYICAECTKSFAWKDNFIRHKKAAHGASTNY